MTCAILAGGQSKRMGRDKVTVEINRKALINLVYDKAKEVFQDIIIISNNHKTIQGIEAPIMRDIMPARSPSVGIVSALVYASNPYVFVLACDMPFLSTDALKYMVNEVAGEDIIIPRTKWGFEPLHAIYNRSCMAPLFRLIEQNRFKVTDLLPFVKTRELGEAPCFFKEGTSVFANINTVNDLEMLETA
ncbi:MAG: hypothetical protein C0399_07095 [Syntrophus sp. (in: bacteria)]|nr:hypothetical protein [Syntrophus sp. (in: bacteria)]